VRAPDEGEIQIRLLAATAEAGAAVAGALG
jgi:hypothetical protein